MIWFLAIKRYFERRKEIKFFKIEFYTKTRSIEKMKLLIYDIKSIFDIRTATNFRNRLRAHIIQKCSEWIPIGIVQLFSRFLFCFLEKMIGIPFE